MVVLALGVTSCGDQEGSEITPSSNSSNNQATTTDNQTGSNYPTDWVKHDPGGNTKCSDGSSFSFFSRDAVKDKVLLFFQGGGACWSEYTCNTLTTYKATVSENDNPVYWKNGIFDLGNKANPFADWTIVFVPYCTADVHIGAAIGNYSGKVLHHQGRANSQSALNYIFNKHSEASEFFVTGSSAGSIGASFYAGVIANKFPDVSITLFNDGSGGLVTNNNIDLMTILGASNGIPLWVFEKQLNDKSFTLNKTTSAELVIFNWLNRKDMRFGRFDDSKDSTIINFNTLLGSSNEEYIEKIQKAESLIEDNGIEISGFIAKGSAHTILGFDRFYTQETNGVLFQDWLSELVKKGQPEDVHCLDC